MLRQCTTVVVSSPPVAKQQLFNAPSQMRNTSFSPDWANPEFIRSALCGEDLCRIAVSSKRPVSVFPMSTHGRLARSCAAWLKGWSLDGRQDIPRVKIPPVCNSELKDVDPTKLKHINHLTRHHSKVLQEASRMIECGYCGTVADKDPSVIWIQQASSAVVRTLGQLFTAGGQWSVYWCSRPRLTAYYRRVIDLMLPRQLRPSRTSFSARNVPYAYPTLKDKCWYDFSQGNVSHTCSDPTHSCTRVICSFNLTIRRQLRFASRAVRFLLKMCWLTFDVDDLSRAPHQFKQGVSRLQQHGVDVMCPNGRCVCCGTELYHPSVVVADAGQAYEVPPVSKICASITALFESATKL